MKRTGVFATAEEVERLKGLMNTPLISLDGINPIGRNPQLACHEMALKHDLPEIKGYYGCDLETGEFVTA